jgi:arsenate reductase
MRKKIHVLFLCTYNSARSQMAEGYLRSIAGNRLEIASAGLEPAGVHPLAIRAMQEVGIDISGQRSKPVNPFLGDVWHYVITVCDHANAYCPIFSVSVQTAALEVPGPVTCHGHRGRAAAGVPPGTGRDSSEAAGLAGRAKRPAASLESGGQSVGVSFEELQKRCLSCLLSRRSVLFMRGDVGGRQHVMYVKDATRKVLCWGWLRLLLGIV